MSSGIWGDPNAYTKAETDAAIDTAIGQQVGCKIVTGIRRSISIPNQGTVNIDFSSDVPSGYIVRNALVNVGGYPLPYLDGSTYTTVRTITNEGNVTIQNTASGWGTSNVSAILFLVES